MFKRHSQYFRTTDFLCVEKYFSSARLALKLGLPFYRMQLSVLLFVLPSFRQYWWQYCLRLKEIIC
jgi:hypothetical protein